MFIIQEFTEYENVDQLAVLFDLYRVFYSQESNVKEVKKFLKDRIKMQDSKIFVAIDLDHKHIVGFVQLFPSFSSVSLKRVWILNDLYILESERNKGIASKLMEHTEKFAKRSGAARIQLATAKNNEVAQKLYEKLNWQKDDFIHYKKFL